MPVRGAACSARNLLARERFPGSMFDRRRPASRPLAGLDHIHPGDEAVIGTLIDIQRGGLEAGR